MENPFNLNYNTKTISYNLNCTKNKCTECSAIIIETNNNNNVIINTTVRKLSRVISSLIKLVCLYKSYFLSDIWYLLDSNHIKHDIRGTAAALSCQIPLQLYWCTRINLLYVETLSLKHFIHYQYIMLLRTI